MANTLSGNVRVSFGRMWPGWMLVRLPLTLANHVNQRSTLYPVAPCVLYIAPSNE